MEKKFKVNQMSDEIFKDLRPFTFEEMYEILREYVNSPAAREALATYDAEDAAGRGDLTNSSVCSDLAFDSHGNFKGMGSRILHNNGWPSLGDILRYAGGNGDLRTKMFATHDAFHSLGRRLIRKEPRQQGWPFQDEEFNIDDKVSVFKLLKLRADMYSGNALYTLTEDE